MRVKQNSVTVEEQLEDGSPYKLWDADLYECAECGVEVITGFGKSAFVEHWQRDYQVTRDRFAARGPIYPGRCRAAAEDPL
jgi:hypothetical protein